MEDSGRQRWLITAILVGVLYGVVGVIFARLSGAATSNQMGFFWRWSAFVISGLVFAAHIAHEHFRRRNSARTTAWHTSVAAAIGGFVLALVANVHEWGLASPYRPRMVISLVVWPLLTGVPAFIAALVVAAGLGRLKRSA